LLYLQVDILKPEHRHLAERFARKPSREYRFALGDWSRGRGGAPVLADATAWLECDGSKLIYAEGSYHVLRRGRGSAD
jgi:flavin reductase (DIM6/NTAB) family NADH-FMN oxidoreductase RutF